MATKAEKKKELKKRINAIRESGCPYHINLTISSIEEMEAWLEKASGWKPVFSEPEESKAESESESIEPILAKIRQSKTLKELGEAIASLSGKGVYKNWELKYWDKNGECRIYLTDISYANPKDRGYYKIHPDGRKERFSRGNDNFPGLPTGLPATTNNIQAAPKLSATGRAIASLNRQFGVNGWNQFDLEDELEREEYQD